MHCVWFRACEPGCAGGVWGRGEAALAPVTCGEVERGGLPPRRVAAVHLLWCHQPLDSLHVPVAARLEQLPGGRFHGLGRRARAGRAPASAAAARHDPGRRRRRQQQRQQRQQEPRPREQEGEAPRRRRAQGPGRSDPCCHRARRSPMAAPPRAPRSASRPRLPRGGGRSTANPPFDLRSDAEAEAGKAPPASSSEPWERT